MDGIPERHSRHVHGDHIASHNDPNDDRDDTHKDGTQCWCSVHVLCACDQRLGRRRNVEHVQDYFASPSDEFSNNQSPTNHDGTHVDGCTQRHVILDRIVARRRNVASDSNTGGRIHIHGFDCRYSVHIHRDVDQRVRFGNRHSISCRRVHAFTRRRKRHDE